MTSTLSRFHMIADAWPVPTVVLTDAGFWHHHQRELSEWCREHGAEQRGMTLTMDRATLTLFALRWA